MQWIQDIINKIAHDGNHDMALSMVKTQFIEVNEYGELTPFASDINPKDSLLIISDCSKMTEELYDILIANASDVQAGESTIYFTNLGYSQSIVDKNDVYSLCDVLELINNN